MLIVGLGNPGRRYARTRHNAGFMVVDRLAQRWGANCDRKQLGALVDRVRIDGQDAYLVKPQSFMNLSGQPTVSLAGYYKVPRSKVLVVHDDLDLSFGTVKLKVGGGHGGHNGLKDLTQKLGGPDYIRVRVGVSRPPSGWDTADYVLSKFTSDEQVQLDSVIDAAADAVEAVLTEGPRQAMNRVNARSRSPQANAETDAADATSGIETNTFPPSSHQ